MAWLLATAQACVPARLSDLHNLLLMIWNFLSLSLFSLGGGNTLLREFRRMAVSQFCWITSDQFSDLYALSEATPGPSSMIVGLIGMGAGWREGPMWALLSGVAAEVSILLPSTLLMVIAALSWSRFKDSPWRISFQHGMGPITLGILFSVGVKILQTSCETPLAYAISFTVCILMLRTKISPLVFMGVAGFLGGMGWIARS
jgi:chromate transporter